MAGEETKYETVIEIPQTYKGVAVTQILANGFRDLPNLQYITIPEGLLTINDYAFYGCISLNTVALPSTLTSIGRYAFNNCTNIKEVTIPASVNFIGKYAYYGSSLTSAVFENANGWKLENDISYVSYTQDKSYGLYSRWQNKININKTGYYYLDSSYYYYTLSFNITNASTVATAFKGTGTMTGSYYYSSDKTPESSAVFTVKLYTENWIRI